MTLNRRKDTPIEIRFDVKIKAYTTRRYTVELYETSNLSYIVKYENHLLGEPHYSELLSDYNMASYMFDLKCEELQGN